MAKSVVVQPTRIDSRDSVFFSDILDGVIQSSSFSSDSSSSSNSISVGIYIGFSYNKSHKSESNY